MSKAARLLMVLSSTLVLSPAAAADPAANDVDVDLEAMVRAMARVGRAFSPSLSPDGRDVAYLTDLSGSPQVWVVAAEGGYPRQVTALDDPVGTVAWSPREDLLGITVLPGGGLNSQIYVVRPDGTGLRRLTDGGRENNWLNGWSDDGRFLAYASNRRDAAAMDAYLLDVRTGEQRLVARNPGIGSWSALSRDGRYGLLSRTRSRGDNDLYLVELATGRETHLTPHTPPAQFSGEFGPNSDAVYVRSNDDRDLFAFGRVRIGADGTPGPIEILVEREDAELDGFRVDHDGSFAILTWNVAGRNEVSFYDIRQQRHLPGIAVPGDLVGSVDFSRAGGSAALVASGATRPPDVWMLDLERRQVRQLTYSPHPGVNLETLVRPELVHYRAHDGLGLSGWLYRPHDFRAPGPLVLSFHGGPEAQERPAFRSDYQALLIRGIAVFAPNVRGSSGFGKRFVNLDNGALRVDAVRDIRSTADFLVEAGIADRRRMGITGGSYGGYMTMAGLTDFPDLFAAGANLFGVVNFKTFFENTEPWMAAISTVEYGDPETEAELLASLSPIHRLDRIRAATLVLHGANDTNVPVIEAEQIVDTLRLRGVPVEYILFPDEGHGWRKIPNRIRSTLAVTEFFSRHLGPASQPSPGEEH
jgi:dipeptidyl aminopeptidase/acylaminoacyl peptidase